MGDSTEEDGARDDEPAAGRLEAIWRKRARRGPMDPLERGRLREGEGLEGNADTGGYRQVTIIARAAWEAAEDELGRTVDPAARRANLLVSGVELAHRTGDELAVGDARLLVRGETKPCGRMDEAADGLRSALETEWRGGVYAEVISGAEIRVGDEVRWV